jgi:photosystem II stability/assembly factor-like uncharacterized protein
MEPLYTSVLAVSSNSFPSGRVKGSNLLMKKTIIILFIPFFLTSCEELGLSRKTSIDGLKLDFHTYGQQLQGSIGPIFFTSEQSGYFSVTIGVCKTVDGGETFRRLDLQTEGQITDVYFLNSSEGFITSAGRLCNQYSSADCKPRDAVISHTTDGGETWSQTSVPSASLSSIHFNTEKSGFAVGSKIFATNDGGISWEEVNVGGGYSQVEFANEKKGLLFRSDGNFLRTTDGGQTWEVGPRVPVVPDTFRGRASVATENIIYFSTEFKIYRSTNWGDTWDELPNAPSAILGLVGVSEDVLFVVGRGKSSSDDMYHAMLYYSTDGGQSWRGTRKVYEVSTLWGAHFPSSDVGYAYGGTTLVKISRD